jgi:hypothetical protein
MKNEEWGATDGGCEMTMNNQSDFLSRIPDFGTTVPVGYKWLLEKNLIGFEPFSQMEPWYFMDDKEHFEISSIWPEGKLSNTLVAFTRRQDSDDIAS